MKNVLFQLAELGTDEARILYKSIKENPEHLKDQDKLMEYFNFLLVHCRCLQSAKIIKLNKQVAEGIDDLAYEAQWTNLLGVMKHAFDAIIEAIKKDKDISDTEPGKMLKKSIELTRDFEQLPFEMKEKVINFVNVLKKIKGEI